MDTHTRLHECLSALADGELAPSELELAYAALATEPGRQAWQAYRCIGDALRSEQAALFPSAQFEARLASRLAQEAPPVPVAASAAAEPVPPAGLPARRPLAQR